MKRALLVSFGAFLVICGVLMAGDFRPVVDMTITSPDGQSKTLTVKESGLATETVANAEYGFRPTIIDSKPWTRVTVTIFKMGTATEYTKELGEVNVHTGGAVVTSETKPSFKVAVTKVTPAQS